MTEPIPINMRHIARSLRISISQVEAVVQLLDEGKTVPFIARYRKDQTGGLEEEQVRRIRTRLMQARLLAQRKAAILRSIQLQGKLTPELEAQICTATTPRRLEDLYLPYKPKKEGLATTARARGLEPLAEEILQAAPSCAHLEARAADFVNPDKQVRTPADALLGAGHILAEMISERADLRKKLREVFYATGQICSKRLETVSTRGGPAPASATPSSPHPSEPSAQQGARSQPAPKMSTRSGEIPPNTSEASGSEQSSAFLPSGESQSPPTESPSPDSVSSPDARPKELSVSSESSPLSAGDNPTPSNEDPPTEGNAPTEGNSPTEGNAPNPTSQPALPEVRAEQTKLSDSPPPKKVDPDCDPSAQVPNSLGNSSMPVEKVEKESEHCSHPDQSQCQGGESNSESLGRESENCSHPDQSPCQGGGSNSESVGRESEHCSYPDQSPCQGGESNSESVEKESEHCSGEGHAPDSCSETSRERSLSSAVGAAGEGKESEVSAAGTEPIPNGSPKADGRGSAELRAGGTVSGPLASAPARSSSRPLTQAALRRQQKEWRKQRDQERRLQAYAEFFDFRQPLRKIPPHRVLALNRAERLKIVRVWIECDLPTMQQVLEEECVPPDHPHADFLRGCGEDALHRWIVPSLQHEARRELLEKAEAHAVEVFAKVLRKMLLQRPVRGQRILAVDPGLRNGCCVVALDEFGNVLDHGVVHLVGRPKRREEARKQVLEMIRRYRTCLVVIGNGAGSRIVEDFIAELISNELKAEDVRYGVVSAIGASAYGSSSIGQEEFPHYDPRLRSTISVGRRVLDPLSELVKIEPSHLATGTYQYDVKAKHLHPLLEEVVQSCVNRVGVDVNTASPWLLRYVSGLNPVLARRVDEYRRLHGQFRNRNQLKDIPGFGEGTFELSAGFLKIGDGEEPFDRTGIHPESYGLAQRILEKVSAQPQDFWNSQTADSILRQLAELDVEALAQELVAGVWTVRQVLGELRRPGRDPREDFFMPLFKRAPVKMEDLTPDMELTGTIVHVVPFGAFVDIGLPESGLVHISQMADRYVRDPRELVSIGDDVKVWVLQVDRERRRISLSMIPPDRRAQAAQGPRTHRAPTAPSEKPAPAQSPSPSSSRRVAPPSTGRPPRPRKRTPSDSGREFRSKAPPPPVIKLSEAVKQGKQPMRTFGELLQFFQLTRQASSAQPAGSEPSAQSKDPKPSTPSDSSKPSASPGAPEPAPSPSPPSPEITRSLEMSSSPESVPSPESAASSESTPSPSVKEPTPDISPLAAQTDAPATFDSPNPSSGSQLDAEQ